MLGFVSSWIGEDRELTVLYLHGQVTIDNSRFNFTIDKCRFIICGFVSSWTGDDREFTVLYRHTQVSMENWWIYVIIDR